LFIFSVHFCTNYPQNVFFAERSLLDVTPTPPANLNLPGDRRPLSAKASSDNIEDYLKNWKKTNSGGSTPTKPPTSDAFHSNDNENSISGYVLGQSFLVSFCYTDHLKTRHLNTRHFHPYVFQIVFVRGRKKTILILEMDHLNTRQSQCSNDHISEHSYTF
jgi:hypothetical protein